MRFPHFPEFSARSQAEQNFPLQGFPANHRTTSNTQCGCLRATREGVALRQSAEVPPRWHAIVEWHAIAQCECRSPTSGPLLYFRTDSTEAPGLPICLWRWGCFGAHASPESLWEAPVSKHRSHLEESPFSPMGGDSSAEALAVAQSSLTPSEEKQRPSCIHQSLVKGGAEIQALAKK